LPYPRQATPDPLRAALTTGPLQKPACASRMTFAAGHGHAGTPCPAACNRPRNEQADAVSADREAYEDSGTTCGSRINGRQRQQKRPRRCRGR
jgi:hypothetical protein